MNCFFLSSFFYFIPEGVRSIEGLYLCVGVIPQGFIHSLVTLQTEYIIDGRILDYSNVLRRSIRSGVKVSWHLLSSQLPFYSSGPLYFSPYSMVYNIYIYSWNSKPDKRFFFHFWLKKKEEEEEENKQAIRKRRFWLIDPFAAGRPDSHSTQHSTAHRRRQESAQSFSLQIPFPFQQIHHFLFHGKVKKKKSTTLCTRGRTAITRASKEGAESWIRCNSRKVVFMEKKKTGKTR